MATMKFRLEMDPKGVGQYLRSESVRGHLVKEGQAMAKRAKTNSAGVKGSDGSEPEFSVKAFQGKDRVRVHVATANPAAMIAEAQQRALMRAMGGGLE